MKILNKLPLIIGLFFIWLYFHSNNNKVNYQVPKQVYQIKEGSIYDGDTLRVLSSDNQELKIRFACIDASEISQPFGKTSRDFLRNLLRSHGNKIMVNIITEDRYDRSVAELYLPDGRLVQEIQAIEGMVYPYERYSSDCPSWEKVAKAGKLAKARKKGVWAKNYETPWDYRKRTKY